MNRTTRDKFASGTETSGVTSGNSCWETPPLVWADLHAAFTFDLDLCADRERRLVANYCGPDHDDPARRDALTVDWRLYGRRAFANPPYGRFVPRLLAKARLQARCGVLSVLLLPVRMTKAFHQEVLGSGARLMICDKRLSFFENGVPRLNERAWRERGKAIADPALFDSMLVVFDPSRVDRPTTIKSWRVPPHVTKADLERAAEARRAREKVPA